MINFRFHLVSLVAVFLALAVGIVMGSTVIDRAIVDGLRSRIDRVERNAEARRAENLELKGEVERLNAYADQALPHLVSDRLKQVPVVVVAIRGVDDETVRAAAETLAAGGAELAGVLWVEPAFVVSELDRQEDLGRAVGEPLKRGAPLYEAAVGLLARRLALGPAPGPGAEDLLVALQDAEFVRFQPLGDDVDLTAYPSPGSRVVVIDGSEGKLAPALGALPLVRAIAGAGAPVVLGEVFRPVGDKTARGDVVRVVRDDRALAAQVATVDDLDVPSGRVAAVLAVAELGRGRAGHYGQGPGAGAQLPAPAAAAPAAGS